MKKIFLIVALIPIIQCSSNQSYNVTGTIIEIRKESNQFLIHHDEIPGFMMKMTMPFTLQDSTDIEKFSIGDSLQFKLIINNETAFANHFTLLGKGTIIDYDNFWDDQYSALDIGQILTDVKLLDTDSIEILISDTDGKFRLISYIFTRCPMPNMCPAAIVKNQYLAENFERDDMIDFILISFDYNYDTPSVLRKTYSNILKSYNNIKIYSSTNHINDIMMLAGQSAVSFWGIEENDIGHNLRSILIDPERRILKSYDGIDWKPESAKRDIDNIIKAYN